MDIDVLAFEAHPDDVELTCAATLIKLAKQGYRVGVVALTKAELSTRGDVQIRLQEFAVSAERMGLTAHVVLDIPDGDIEINLENKRKVIQQIRTYRPKLVFAPYWIDRHPDHSNASELVRQASFFAGLSKIDTQQPAYRPGAVIYYPLHQEFTPSFVVDVTETFEAKLEAIRCYRSQVHTGADEFRDSDPTYISSPEFTQILVTRARYWGSKIGAEYGEPFLFRGPVPIADPVAAFSKFVDMR